MQFENVQKKMKSHKLKSYINTSSMSRPMKKFRKKLLLSNFFIGYISVFVKIF